jgi:hypothetical protein
MVMAFDVTMIKALKIVEAAIREQPELGRSEAV